MIISIVWLLVSIRAGCHTKLYIWILSSQLLSCFTIVIACRKYQITACIYKSFKIFSFCSPGNIIHMHNFNLIAILFLYIRKCLYEIVCICSTCITYIYYPYLDALIFIFS